MSKPEPIPDSDFSMLTAFVGPNSDILAHQIQKASTGRMTWSWPAFVLGPIYFAYRKMYHMILIWISITFILDILSSLTRVPALMYGVGLPAGMAVGFYRFYGNAYKNIYRKSLSQCNDTEALKSNLQQAGGTDRNTALFACGVVFLIIIFVLSP